ncbi:MAG: hypothetical protein M3530_03090, partial [Thermoproteota archaeon]|nr:hypothetical protein [Thermoproteota archaeon]
LIPWVYGYTVPINHDIDISILTWISVFCSLISSSVWFVMQAIFVAVGNKMKKYQSTHVRDTRIEIPYICHCTPNM